MQGAAQGCGIPGRKGQHEPVRREGQDVPGQGVPCLLIHCARADPTGGRLPAAAGGEDAQERGQKGFRIFLVFLVRHYDHVSDAVFAGGVGGQVLGPQGVDGEQAEKPVLPAGEGGCRNRGRDKDQAQALGRCNSGAGHGAGHGADHDPGLFSGQAFKGGHRPPGRVAVVGGHQTKRPAPDPAPGVYGLDGQSRPIAPLHAKIRKLAFQGADKADHHGRLAAAAGQEHGARSQERKNPMTAHANRPETVLNGCSLSITTKEFENIYGRKEKEALKNNPCQPAGQGWDPAVMQYRH